MEGTSMRADPVFIFRGEMIDVIPTDGWNHLCSASDIVVTPIRRHGSCGA